MTTRCPNGKDGVRLQNTPSGEGDPNLTDRNVDAWDEATRTAFEVKNSAAKNVAVDSHIRAQKDKEVWLKTNLVGGYNPIWIFIDKGPTRGLQDLLESNDIPFILLR